MYLQDILELYEERFLVFFPLGSQFAVAEEIRVDPDKKIRDEDFKVIPLPISIPHYVVYIFGTVIHFSCSFVIINSR